MDEVKELKTFEEIKEEVSATRGALEEDVNKHRAAIKDAKDYLNEQYEDMDVNELSENVQSINNMTDVMSSVASDLRNLKVLEESPYFARVDFLQNGQMDPLPFRIGPGGFWSEKDNEQKIIDWRAPAATLFYDYKTGPAGYRVETKEGMSSSVKEIKGTITDRAQLVTKSGSLDVIRTGESISDEMLLAALGGNAPEKMRPVVSTIQHEQNEIIRDNTSEVLVVDGRAGSGKTVIAMHRLSWLLYNRRKQLNSGNVMILSPNTIFSDYISDIMPELMEDPVPEKEWDDLAAEILLTDIPCETRQMQAEVIRKGEDKERISNIVFKSSIAFFDAVESYVNEVIAGHMQFSDFRYEKQVFPKEKLEKYYYENFKSLPPYERLYNIAYFIMEDVLALSGRNFGEGRQERMQNVIWQMLLDRFAEKNVLNIYRDILSVVAKVRPDAEEILTEEGLIRYEDLQVLLYLQVKLYGCKTYKEVKHLMVDEMQDYTVFQLAVMKEVFGGRKTFLGDRLQTLIPSDDENVLDSMIRIFPERTLRVLSTSYRSTAEIAAFCNGLIGEEDAAEAVERHGKAPEVIKVSADTCRDGTTASER
ncbi:MAG: AAA family ATPase [Lachnospiraceae bacterium]|nr:AAA family ATPase [Lachnospiraceae bacterium]